MSLEKYKKKRKFTKTPEPRGKPQAKGSNRFVVQKHQARALHYDFRLELPASAPGGALVGKPDKIDRGPIVLKSWAVPKGVPVKAGVKHLAVATEDHPVDYINFKGVIPEGQYGAGTVEIWDKGKFKLLEVGSKSLKFELKGKRLKGKYVLFNLKGRNWLVFKMK